MARRSAHTPDELRQKILEASQTIIERDGLVGLSAREIARAIGYSPGTLYNIFENLDDVLLTLQTNMVSEVLELLHNIDQGASQEETIEIYARTYLAFALDNKFMWNLLFTHNMPQNTTMPTVLIENVNKLAAVIESTVSKMIPDAEPQQVHVAARTLWASVHGITAIAVTEKGPTLTPATAHIFVDHLVKTYLRGLKA